MPDDPQWPTEDDDAESVAAAAQSTVQVNRPSVDQPTMRLPLAAVLAAPSTQEPLRSSPVRSSPNATGPGRAAPGVPTAGSGGSSGDAAGGKSHGTIGPEVGQPRALPVRVEPKRDQTRVVPRPEQRTSELSVPPGKTARVDQLPHLEQSWFDQQVKPERQQHQQPRPEQTKRVDQLQGQAPPRQEQPRQEQQRQEPQRQEPQRQEPQRQEPQRQEPQRHEPQRHEPARPVPPPRQESRDVPVTGYEEEPEDRLAEEPRKSRKPLIAVLSLLVVAALAGATVYAVKEFGGTKAVETRPPAAPANVQPLVKAVTAGAPAPTAAGVKQALTGPAGNSALGTLTGSVIDPASGTALWQQGDTTAATPASSLKILTAAAALLSLEKTDQLSTKVVQGAEPGTVVIVGGGDPTISGAPGKSVYPGAATLDDLVGQVKAKGPVTKVQFDLSRYAGEALGPQWEAVDIAGGSVAPIVPFMLDGGRIDQTNVNGARTGSPGQAAADAFAQRVGASGATAGAAPAGAQVLGEIKSASIEQLVDNMMQISDNVLTEAIAREVAIKTGNEPSFAGGVKAVRDVLTKNGFDLTAANFVDGSGLSASNKIPAKLLTDVLTAAAKPTLDDARTAKLRPLLTALPVAGGSGTLAGRYGGTAAPGKGWVRAKTGTLTGVNALAGVVVDVDGRVLVFSFMSASNRNPETEVRPALDVLAAALRGCGCS
ncbi:D-alanyl-D-alanine carboxypeptidase/D-alanyl-D-alanine endopeptidase [Lentzea flaviverrucosa]|uniref:D-alanyl-D-alanine carboxypeptidase / D-alanyl-D-alanine-endopeptidase (Penicillin-binding protein 4) n=1 Tax=Lentzea flaviverrucosa TaxID=200379 RepID=A0A1H9X536_9PSEU|nr:D-alanyl-D-alanine carboxypeptidase/D-alanyl-D-alanine-endopeptidase [Lentzea flaviverrucosa]RDI20889.1 D-alanyl-D-alanine carboxypeptidase/D-alanyl-D-alanine-endopeptidase (penicillin-binding protein 4) [Lentzea flaviverrucosa]SES40723.1 D-alanyl-D-alanine carboxypeptidase / D-alanyl-D-alanine-endopeptidase (penicillin-binding protein 4) [Lentzea flaviverrucosa]